MTKRRKAPTNLGQGIPRIGGELVDRLNKLDEGLGTALAYELNHRFSLADVRTRAAAGHAGTVVIAEQPRDSVGNKANAVDISGGNIGASAWASQGDQLTPLSQVRSLFTCDHFGGHPSGFPGWFEDCVQEKKVPPGEIVPAGVVPYFYGYCYDNPTFSDTTEAHVGDGARNLNFWYMPIPSAVTLGHVSFVVTRIVIPGNLVIVFYDVNRDLVFQSQQIPFGDGPVGTGVGRFEAFETPVTLPEGGYFMGIIATGCNIAVSLLPNDVAWAVAHRHLVDSGVDQRFFYYGTALLTEDFGVPANLDDVPIEIISGTSTNIPMLFFEP